MKRRAGGIDFGSCDTAIALLTGGAVNSAIAGTYGAWRHGWVPLQFSSTLFYFQIITYIRLDVHHKNDILYF